MVTMEHGSALMKLPGCLLAVLRRYSSGWVQQHATELGNLVVHVMRSDQ